MDNIKDNKALHTIVGGIVLWFAWRWYFSGIFFESLYTLNGGEMPLGMEYGSTESNLGVFGTLFLLGLNFVQLVGSMAVAGGVYLYETINDAVQGVNVGFLDIIKDKFTDITGGGSSKDDVSEDSPIVQALIKLDENVTSLSERLDKLENNEEEEEVSQ